jgi:ABC-type phosphate transport system substrate-binding protein
MICLPAVADIAVIVHPSNDVSMDRSAIARLFLGKAKSFPGGKIAVPINLPESAIVREEFEATVLKKQSSQMKAYWSRLIFTGKGSPPKQVNSEDDVISLVSRNLSHIGYIDAGKVGDNVRVIAEF